MYEAQRVLYVFAQLGERHIPELWRYLEEQGMDPSMYATEWFMTLFCRGFSFDLVARVFDIFIKEGSSKILYRVALGLLKVCRYYCSLLFPVASCHYHLPIITHNTATPFCRRWRRSSWQPPLRRLWISCAILPAGWTLKM